MNLRLNRICNDITTLKREAHSCPGLSADELLLGIHIGQTFVSHGDGIRHLRIPLLDFRIDPWG